MSSVQIFRKRPVEVRVMQLTASNRKDVAGWIRANGGRAVVPDDDSCLYIQTMEGLMRSKVGDFVIRGVHGEFYSCDQVIFEKTYEPVEVAG